MTKRIFTRFADLAKYRVLMKRKLRVIGCQFDNRASGRDDANEQLGGVEQ